MDEEDRLKIIPLLIVILVGIFYGAYACVVIGMAISETEISSEIPISEIIMAGALIGSIVGMIISWLFISFIAKLLVRKHRIGYRTCLNMIGMSFIPMLVLSFVMFVFLYFGENLPVLLLSALTYLAMISLTATKLQGEGISLKWSVLSSVVVWVSFYLFNFFILAIQMVSGG